MSRVLGLCIPALLFAYRGEGQDDESSGRS